MKTAELIGAALDWAVARCEGAVSDDIDDFCLSVAGEFAYSTDWAQGGPIIERERIATNYSAKHSCWFAEDYQEKHVESGTTPLIAAMRCYVASKLGDEVEVPNEL